jgi:uncharacterized protein
MISKELETRYQTLRQVVADLESAAVAFSGGVDSTFLLAVARDVLGPERVLAATAVSASLPALELEMARELARGLGVKHVIFESDEMSSPDFVRNSPDRCYYCKQELFVKLKALAATEGLKAVVEASNADDENDYRPGLRAICELGIRSPLREARLGKADVRALSRELGLPTHDKPSFACLASRIPYGEEITEEKLRRIEKAEALLRGMGFRQFRVRSHDTIARIELGPDENLHALLEASARARVIRELKSLGYRYVTLDLEGYRTGSMNEVLSAGRRKVKLA